jgi:hypothetical protein
MPKRKAQMLTISRLALLLAIGLLLAAPAARAMDDAPTPDERTRIESALRQMGFVSWGDIESQDDGGEWEVNDARTKDGSKFDLRLSGDDLWEMARRADD